MTTATKYRLGYGDYLRFRQLVLNRSGLHFPEKKRADLENGILKALRNAPNGIANVDSYYTYLEQANDKAAQREVNRLINILTIGETHFFRDSAQFDALATRVLPALIARKRAAVASVGTNPPIPPQLRIWSAGCATGEEPYSLAILLHELIPDIQNWHVLILGTDINEDLLAQAREASYSDWSFRVDRAKSIRQLYFKRQGKRYQLRQEIRRQVTFACHNLIEEDFPSVHNNIVAMDLILCRNVTIYFTPETTRQLIKKFYATLIDGGWLVVGHSEPSLATYRDFQAYTYPKAILYQKTGHPTPWPDDWDDLGASHNGVTGNSQTSPPLINQLNPTQHITLPANIADGVLVPAAVEEPDEIFPRRYEKAQSLLAQGEIELAIQTLEGLVAERKMFAPAHCLLARAYANRGQWQQARASSQQAIECDSLQPAAYYVLALVDENEGHLRQAIDNFRKVIYLDPKGPLPYFHLAVLYKKEGQPDHARRALNNVIRILQTWSPDAIIPESGGTAERLLKAARQILTEI